MVLPSIESHGPIEAWIIDDTGFPKKGEHSVGVATAVSSVSGRTAKWRCRCHSPITTRACRWPGVSIYRKSGRPTMNVGARRASPTRWILRTAEGGAHRRSIQRSETRRDDAHRPRLSARRSAATDAADCLP
jgi:hypothetical protein